LDSCQGNEKVTEWGRGEGRRIYIRSTAKRDQLDLGYQLGNDHQLWERMVVGYLKYI
jgi:hypothetical protein